MGYTRHVGMDFLEHMERSLLYGQVPEYQFKCRKIDNSEDDPVCGHVVDIVYEISMPVIVKSEKVNDEDEDLVLLGVTPGIPMSRVPINVIVKKEKTDNTQESQDTNMQSQFVSPIFGNKAPEMGESSQGKQFREQR